MHIPDGYLSPQTCAVGLLVAVPMLGIAAARVKDRVRTRNVPTLAMLASACFLIMMFNVPVPNGATAHAVGGALIAILLGPWAAVIAVTVALAFQALLFGDGGILALGVNVVNLAIVLPFVAYGLYKLLSTGSTLTSSRRVVSAFIAGYVSITVAALLVGVQLGIQPGLFHDATGAPLYSPYHLSQTIPAMLLAHLLVAGVAEGILSAAVLAYLRRANLPLLKVNHPRVPVDAAERGEGGRLRPGLVALVTMAILVVLTPLGLLATGSAFGEDAPENLIGKLGLSAVPDGLKRYTDFWQHALFPDYLSDSAWTYILSAIIGIVVVGVAAYGIGLLIVRVFGRRGGATSEEETAGRSAASAQLS